MPAYESAQENYILINGNKFDKKDIYDVVAKVTYYSKDRNTIDYIGNVGLTAQLVYSVAKSFDTSFNFINPKHVDDVHLYMKSDVLLVDRSLEHCDEICNCLPEGKKSVKINSVNAYVEKNIAVQQNIKN